MTTGPTSQIALAIFPRLPGVVYLLAFVSLLGCVKQKILVSAMLDRDN